MSPPQTEIDPAGVLEILPTPPGLDQSNDVTKVDAAKLQTILAGVTSAEAAKVYEDIGFHDGAIRTWSGPDGTRLLVTISRWPDRQTATNVGGGVVNRILDTTSTAAWTPKELPGARGARPRTPGPAAVRVLSLAVADVSLLVRGEGSLTDQIMIRTMDLLARPVRAAAP